MRLEPDYYAVWQGKFVIISTAIVFTILAVVLNFLLPREYTATMMVGEKTSSLMGMNESGSSLATSLGSLAGLGPRQSSLYDQYQVLLYSQDTAKRLLADPKLLARAMRVNYSNGKWKQPNDIIAATKNSIKRVLGLTPWHPPRVENVQKYLSRNLRMSFDRRTNFITLAYRNRDPVVAHDFLLHVHLIVDDALRQAAIQFAKYRIQYLEQQLKTATVEDYKNTLTNLLLSESKSLMVSKSDKTYSVDVIDSPIVPRIPSTPNVRLNLVLGFLLGLVLSSAAFLFMPRQVHKAWNTVAGHTPWAVADTGS